ncbi:UNVERIFIED_CONTAM: hypothetical protein PYX00_001971 [Menopon gallinae]|uniref:Mitochondrial ribosomal protein L41 n=1 Tax=Menopon gallinae TaxID=328185 RepID=A0AAW2IES0_9NEOP
MAAVRPFVKYTQGNVRGFSTSSVCNSLRNFRKIVVHNRGGRRYLERMKKNPDPDIPIYDYNVRQPGYEYRGKFHLVPEMVPEIIVPDLTDCELKPYVSYKVKDVVQSEFTSKDLFNAVYAKKIVNDFKTGKLDENGNPKEPSKYESQTAEEATLNALKTGSDFV